MESYKILIVDDDLNILKALEKSLDSEYKIFSATSAQDALTLMESQDIALVISDQKMTGMTGVELMEELARRYPDTVRIIMTGYAESDLYIDAINVGHIYGFINKPWKIVELREMVKKALTYYEKTQVLREPHVRTLLDSGMISVDQLESVLQSNAESGKSVGDILVENGIILPSELNMAMELGESENKQLEDVLLERGIVFEADLQMALEKQKHEKKSLTRTLIDMEYADEDSILACYALQLGMPYIPLSQFPKRKNLAKILSSRLAYKYSIMPIDLVAQTLVIVASEPLDEEDKSEIEEETGKRVMVALAKQREIEEILREYYNDLSPLEERSNKMSTKNNKGATVNA